MKVALVHDYLNEFGGAERVLKVLAEMYPEAPIYTAFFREGSDAYSQFQDRRVIASWAQKVPGFATKLHSPLRFLAPLIWESFNLDQFDIVISSASWYITKGVLTRPETLHICYCHTPPRYLYGYDTSINWRKYWLVKVYAGIVNKYLREYDFVAAQRVDHFVANSKNVQERIKKFYRRDSTVIFPPVEIKPTLESLPLVKGREERVSGKQDYFLVVSRVVGGKGLLMAIEAANQLKVPLKVVGTGAGWGKEEERVRQAAGPTIEFLGFVEDADLADIYAGAKAFLALARDEDFGITPVEAMMAGTPVIAYRGGGYLETVKDGVSGIFFDDYSTKGVVEAISKFKTQSSKFKAEEIKMQAEKFSKERFVKEMGEFVEEKWQEKCASS